MFFGYDFHLDHGRLGLIEINTNAGGAMLNAVLARAQRSCCAAMDAMVPTRASVAAFEQRLVDMFRHEWRLARQGRTTQAAGAASPSSTRHPSSSTSTPSSCCSRDSSSATACARSSPTRRRCNGATARLWHGELAIDLVYNRLTDFYLEQPASAALREAYEQQGVVLTPHPQAHALYADKRQLALFSDAARLQALGVPETTRQLLLDHVPHTEVVNAADGERLWAARRGLFFKPVAGFGSRAAYRGDKLTRRVWQEILAGDYVAQAIVPPGERLIEGDDTAQAMKFDLRAYAYGGEVQWVAARLYQGQTTNFRTPGGGFAPVYSTIDASGRTLRHVDGEHASYVFLLDEAGGVHAVPHALFVALARHEAAAPTLAGQTLRLADWYVRLKNGEPDAVVNETYAVVRVDAHGRVESVPAPAEAGWPTAEERRAHARPAVRGGRIGPVSSLPSLSTTDNLPSANFATPRSSHAQITQATLSPDLLAADGRDDGVPDDLRDHAAQRRLGGRFRRPLVACLSRRLRGGRAGDLLPGPGGAPNDRARGRVALSGFRVAGATRTHEGCRDDEVIP